MSDGEINLHDTFDAAVWTEEFGRVVIDSDIEIDRSLMLGWFANAIMAGYDYARRTISTGEPAPEGWHYELMADEDERTHAPFTFSYHRLDGGYTDNPAESDGSLPPEEAVFQALGYASMCWSQTPHGVFDSTAAKSAGDALVAYIKDMT